MRAKQKSGRTSMTTKRSSSAKDFAELTLPPHSVIPLDLEAITTRYHFPEGFSVRIPSAEEKINDRYADEVAIPIDHFTYGFQFPVFEEVQEIFEYYGIVPAQLSPNAIATIISFIVYLREVKTAFSLNVFRNLFFIRSQLKGVLFLGTKKLKVVNASNKILHWTEKFVLVKGDFGRMPLFPVPKAEKIFKEQELVGPEKRIANYLLDSVLDINYYVPRARMALSLTEERFLIVPSEKPQEPLTPALTSAEIRQKRAAERKGKRAYKEKNVIEEEPETSHTPYENPYAGFGKSFKDIKGNPLMEWDVKKEKVSLSMNLPSWKEEVSSGKAAMAISCALAGNQDVEELDAIPVHLLPRLAARSNLRAVSINHMVYCKLQDVIHEKNEADERIAALENKIQELQKNIDEAYSLDNPVFTKKMMVYCKDSAEDTIIRMKDKKIVKGKYSNITYEDIFPEMAGFNISPSAAEENNSALNANKLFPAEGDEEEISDEAADKEVADDDDADKSIDKEEAGSSETSASDEGSFDSNATSQSQPPKKKSKK